MIRNLNDFLRRASDRLGGATIRRPLHSDERFLSGAVDHADLAQRMRRASDAAADGRFWLPHGPALQRDGGSR
ncbi:MAG: hypothetical protein ACJ8G7_04710 [Rhizobacter sp.]